MAGGLPGSQTAAITANLEKSRETGPTAFHQSGENIGREASDAKVFVQEVQEEPI